VEFFERHRGGEKAILVHLDLKQQAASLDEDLTEFVLLAKSAGADILATVTGSRQKPDPSLYAGTGKVAEIAELVKEKEADLVLFNHALSPAQERNLEKELQCRVLDRTGLILDIFAQRAQTFEGKLQVELAQLSHLSSRLVRGWTHLERQKGGIGLRGPGETQLETDRRLLKHRVTMLSERLEKVRQTRQQGRASRQKAAIPTVSLVGYTNAGKSTLFNALVKARAYAADQLFATLDTTTRQMYLEAAGCTVSLSDTVGFIRNLPHGLVAAFQATLQETVDADLLLHVVDAANPHHPEQILEVQKVLREIGAHEIPQILVFNKLDALEEEARPSFPKDAYELEGRQVTRTFVSARKAQGLDVLRAVLAEHVLEARSSMMSPEFAVPLQDSSCDWAQSPATIEPRT